MSNASVRFITDAESRVFDPEHRRKLAFNIHQYDKKVEEGKHQFEDFDTARQRANHLKWRAIEQLDKHLIEFEANFIKRGGKVLWANDGEEAIREIVRIL
ncbi:MAG: [Fe-S]-binding protein, partial [Bacteroidota bacterium]